MFLSLQQRTLCRATSQTVFLCSISHFRLQSSPELSYWLLCGTLLTVSMTDFNRVNDVSDPEVDQSFHPKRSTLKRMAVAGAAAMVVCVGILALSTNGFSRNCSNIAALQEKSALDLDSAIRSTSEKLIQAVKNNQTVADETVMKAMVKAGHKIQDHWRSTTSASWILLPPSER